jgi:hypothetical protein
MNWFNYRESQVYKWIRENTLDRIGVASFLQGPTSSDFHAVWKERSDAEAALKVYLSDLPSKELVIFDILKYLTSPSNSCIRSRAPRQWEVSNGVRNC